MTAVPSLRFKVWDAHQEVHANAAVYMLMDCSASMTTDKKYIAKSFFFWMMRFLRRKYHQINAVFIAHDVEARVVPETEFFARSNSGGTRCSSAYQVALKHLLQHHPAARWNKYVFHFSDGDNLPGDNAACKTLVEDLLTHCRMVGYGEIRYQNDASFYGWSGPSAVDPSLLQDILQQIAHPHSLSTTITHQEELYQALQTFLQPREALHV